MYRNGLLLAWMISPISVIIKCFTNHFECIQNALNASMRYEAGSKVNSISELMHIITVVPGV